MSRVLVTGSEGRVGKATVAALAADGHDVVPFDRALGHDMREAAAVRAAADGCDVVVHAAANLHDDWDTTETILSDNVLGVWTVLRAAYELGIGRVVFVSSIQATGVSQSHSVPDYLPLDDDHPSRPFTGYAMSKLLGEQACASYTRATGLTTICLRPPTILAPDEYPMWRERRATVPEVEDPVWNYGTWIDVRDFADATVRALECPTPEGGHAVLLVTGPDVSSNRPGRDVVRERYPDLEWRGGPEWDEDPYRTLVDLSRAWEVLGWTPRHFWQNR